MYNPNGVLPLNYSNGSSAPAYGNNGYLPYTGDLDNGMTELRRLIRSTSMGIPRAQDMGRVGDMARSEAARRGLEGPLAARLANEAQNEFQLGFDSQRFDRLNQLLQNQSTMGLAIQDREAQRRREAAQQMAAYRVAIANRNQMLFKLLGTAGGAVLGSFVGPVGTATGASIGAGLGGAVGGALFPGY